MTRPLLTDLSDSREEEKPRCPKAHRVRACYVPRIAFSSRTKQPGCFLPRVLCAPRCAVEYRGKIAGRVEVLGMMQTICIEAEEEPFRIVLTSTSP